jgi:hypothetical protein
MPPVVSRSHCHSTKSVLGTEQNVTSHVTKWNVDAAGVRQRYQGRNKQQKDIDLFDSAITETLEQLHEDGVDAISLDKETFEYARKTQEYLFVDFYASWYVNSCGTTNLFISLRQIDCFMAWSAMQMYTGVAIASS